MVSAFFTGAKCRGSEGRFLIFWFLAKLWKKVHKKVVFGLIFNARFFHRFFFLRGIRSPKWKSGLISFFWAPPSCLRITAKPPIGFCCQPAWAIVHPLRQQPWFISSLCLPFADLRKQLETDLKKRLKESRRAQSQSVLLGPFQFQFSAANQKGFRPPLQKEGSSWVTLFLLFSFCGFLAQSILSAAFETSMVFFFCKEHVFGVDFFFNYFSSDMGGGLPSLSSTPGRWC